MAEENSSNGTPDAGDATTHGDRSPSKAAELASPARRRAPRRKKLLILVVVLVVVAGGVLFWRYLNSYESTDDAQADVHLYPVSARVSGYVIRVNVNDNQWVEKGTVLVEIDPERLRGCSRAGGSEPGERGSDGTVLGYQRAHHVGEHIEPTAVHRV